MQYWDESERFNEDGEPLPSGVAISLGRIVDIRILPDRLVELQDGSDGAFRIIIPPPDAIAALREAISWIEEKTK